MDSESPMTRLVLEIQSGPGPHRLRGTLSPILVRERIFRTMADELAWKAGQDRPHEPLSDARFCWLMEWAEIFEGLRHRHTHGLEATMTFLFMSPGQFLSGRDLAAGERPEPRTLAQGS